MCKVKDYFVDFNKESFNDEVFECIACGGSYPVGQIQEFADYDLCGDCHSVAVKGVGYDGFCVGLD